MFLDIVIIGLIAVFLAVGAVQGFVVSVLYLSAWVVGILSVWLFARTFGVILEANIVGLEPILALCLGALLAFLLPFLLIRIVALVAKFFINRSSPLTTLNRIMGGLFGILKGMAVSAVVLTIVHLLPAKGSLKDIRTDSKSYSFYESVSFTNIWKNFKELSEGIENTKNNLTETVSPKQETPAGSAK